MPDERCNCENTLCRECKGLGCKALAGKRKAMYVGALCNSCAFNMPPKYMLDGKCDTCGGWLGDYDQCLNGCDE